jgi:hypothetical protein
MVTANRPTGAVTPEEMRLEEMPIEQRMRLQQLQWFVNREVEARKVWNVYFTPSDRDKFNDGFGGAFGRLGTVGMWGTVKGVSYLQALVDVARTLGFSTPSELDCFAYRLGFADPNCEDGLLLTAKRNELVVVLGVTPRIFWLGRELTIDWAKKGASLEYFLKLCRATKEGGVLTNADFDNNEAGNALPNRKMRLVRTTGFPGDLANRIKVLRCEGHTLNIERARLQILELRREPRFVIR